MIKHIVMFKLSENADGKTKKENLDTALEMLKNFKALIPVMKDFKAVTNSPDAPDSNYDLALICDFASIDDLNAYQNHPEHLKFRKIHNSSQRIRACIDYEY